MGNIDIKFLNNEVYLLKTHDMTVEEFESQIADFKYTDIYEKYKDIKDELGVEQTHFPPINIVFYESIFNHSKVIPPQDFVAAYLAYYSDEFKCVGSHVEYFGKSFDVDALSGRILRTYPSLIRDFDFYLMLVESQKFDQIIYSCIQDIKGKDIIIKDHGKKYVVSLYVDTNRSTYFKKLKNAFRHKYDDNEIKMPLKLDEARKCGDFMLYSEQDVERIEYDILN